MPEYRKKPVIIEALQYNGSNHFEIAHFMHLNSPDELLWDTANGTIVIHTLEGDHKANINDFIIRGVKGEYYPCKPDIFKMTYESLDEVRLKENILKGIME